MAGWDWFSATIGFVGGSGAIFVAGIWAVRQAVAHFASRNLQEFQNELDRALERAKASLRREEYIYTFQMQAARDMLKLVSEVAPSRSHDDFSEAMESFAQLGLGRLEGRLQAFMEDHQAILPADVSDQVWMVAGLANEADRTTHYLSEGSDRRLAREDEPMVEEVWTQLGKAQQMIRQLVWHQPGADAESN